MAEKTYRTALLGSLKHKDCDHEHHHHDHNHHSHEHGGGESGWRVWLRAAVAAVMLVAGMALSAKQVGWFQGWTALAWYGIAWLLVGWNVVKEAVETAREGDFFSEFTLMSVASVGAFCIKEYPEAVAVMLLYSVGETLQDMAVDRARSNIKSLIAFRPEWARVDGQQIEPEKVEVGQTVEVRPGERVPLDGVLLTDAAAFNTAALTGESMPRTIESGQEVLAGMIAQESISQIKVTRPAKESAVARILKMVEEATERKAPAELFIRRFARIYTPAVCLLAVLVVLVPWLWSLIGGGPFSFSTWFERALIFLVISCPCALVISIPLSYFAGIGAASRRGILFKGSNHLDGVADLRTVVFDKTGTLTTGRFEVTENRGLSADTLAAVAAIEQTSSHPIAKAIVSFVEERGKRNAAGKRVERTCSLSSRSGEDEVKEEREYSFNSDLEGENTSLSAFRLPHSSKISNLKNIAGRGLEASIDGHDYLVGTTRLLEERQVAWPSELADVPETLVAVARDGQYAGCLLLADTLKDDAQQAIESLKTYGIDTVILSGDKQALVEKTAQRLGIGRAYGNLLPEDKARMMQEVTRPAAFVGDGINDAPVLATADVGIAMGAMGSDMAVETADVVVETDQPSRVAEAVRIGRRTRTIVRENIYGAIAIKVLIMLLGVLGLAGMWAAVFADVGVALLAVANATRIFRSERLDAVHEA